ncbi:MAG: hypothetical protein CVV51_07605 [Spirochaetae bacterium HGW-Spirochaetae-7]|jgi:sugar/nucleoside kinase (ribokinase family)|nr:MAG: hypothetical protein CVV51_07605 [Spirochaetae bacterium HGW-Spirochaetae-7]
MRLACVGNALWDIVSFVGDDFPSSLGYHDGSTTHADIANLEPVIAALPNAYLCAGGGAANAARVFSSLGHDAAFAGMIGSDETGQRFRVDMADFGIESFLQVSQKPTGVFCAMIAPDGTHTVLVAPGAAPFLDAAAVPAAFFRPGSTLYIDGFLASSPEAIERLVHRAKSAGMGIALDVAGSRIAAIHRDFFIELIRTSCSWTFMNEDEFMALADSGVDDALARFSAGIPGVVVVKRAEIGAVCVSDGSVVESSVRPIRATDTTGAGDAFAAGFLSAAIAGSSLARCLRLGNRVAEHAIQVPGMAIDSAGLRRAADAVS